MIRPEGLGQYAIGLAKHLWTTGADVDGPVLRRSAHVTELQVLATLPGSGRPGHASVQILERWQAEAGHLVLSSYLYEFVDRELNRRRGFHLHDVAEFETEYGRPAHEHCEEVLSNPLCPHYHGEVLADGHEAIERLLALWVKPEEPLGCDKLRCQGT